MSTKAELIEQLNSKDASARLGSVAQLARLLKTQGVKLPHSQEVNNHVHTCYSFSPYTPALAVYKAVEAGLQAVGIMDHDSVAGAKELLAACASLGIAATVGFELRVNFNQTAVQGRKLNNPDSENIAYIAVHGIPASRIHSANQFLKPLRLERSLRIRRMTARMNSLIKPLGIKIDYDRDVYALSQGAAEGSVTERHLLYALALKLIQDQGKGQGLLSFLANGLGIAIPSALERYFLDQANPYYAYDLLGVLKSSFLPSFFIQPDYTECVSVFEALDFANSINAIPAYAYLGDVGESPTGDKKAEKFEDEFLDELIPELKSIGFKAVTYMPPRNTLEQLRRIRELCAGQGLMEISGVDINSPRQSFHCPRIMLPEFAHLIDSAWALIAHEKLANQHQNYGLFHEQNPLAGRSLQERIEVYSSLGRGIDQRHPERVGEQIGFLSGTKDNQGD